jgi:hypothetical protein
MMSDMLRGRTLREIVRWLPSRVAAAGGDRWAAKDRASAPAIDAPDGVSATDDAPDTSSCPACGRPLEALTGVCAGCGARLVLGVQARRAAAFTALGLVAGLLVGALGMGLLSSATGTRATVAATGVPGASAGSAAPDAGGDGAPSGAIPAAASSALRQSAAVNARLAVTLRELRASLAATPYDPSATAQSLRDLAADASVAAPSVPGLASWPAAASLQAQLGRFYDGILATARRGLAYSLADAAAYRKAGAEMVARFKALAAIDAASRTLADSAGIAFPQADGAGPAAGSAASTAP